MKNITRHFEVFTWDELSEDAKNKAIDDYIKFLLEVTDYSQASDNMKDEILENLKECQYLHNGELFA